MSYFRTYTVLIIGFVSLCGFITSASAGCKINYSFSYSGKHIGSLKEFKVMSKGGTWKHVLTKRDGKVARVTAMMNSNQEYEDVYNATFRCNAKRRFRYKPTGCDKYIYYPSATKWTTSTNIKFGDIARHCK